MDPINHDRDYIKHYGDPHPIRSLMAVDMPEEGLPEENLENYSLFFFCCFHIKKNFSHERIIVGGGHLSELPVTMTSSRGLQAATST